MPCTYGQSMSAIFRLTAVTLFAGMMFLSASRAFAETQLQPGLWQETEIGSENDRPAKVETSTRCMTAEEAKQPAKAVVFDETLRKRCRTLEFKRTGDDITFRLQCGTDGFAVNMGAAFAIHDPQHYSGTIRASLRLGTFRLSANKKIDAHRIGECKEKE
jgi:hypothetical protein